MEMFEFVVYYVVVLALPSVAYAAINRLIKRLRATSSNSISTPSHPPVAKAYYEEGRFPGPWKLPIIGRIHDVPRFSLWLKFKEWADDFGPIYQTSMAGDNFVIISDEEIAAELLIKNGNSFGGRPQIRALIDHKQGVAYSALMDRHDTWKTQRKWVHAAMAASHQSHFNGHIENEVKRWLVTLLVDPGQFHANTRELTGRIINTLAWDDAGQGRAYGESALATLKQMSISGPVVNALTPLWHLADLVRHNPWRTYEVDREAAQRAWWARSLRVGKARFLRGDLPADTWAYRYCAQLAAGGNMTLEQDAAEEDFAACMLGFQCLVGVITISGPLQFFLMAMALHPEWLARCQEELDRVCGNRMPTVADAPLLPTVRACLKETLRWRPGVPLGVPHQCEIDHEFRGVTIKKGTVIMACEWNINRVPSKYPDPDHYRPDRYLDPAFPTYQEPLTRFPNFREGKSMHTFGWGRRSCVGQLLVDDELLVAGAAVCWGFDMGPKKCPVTGNDVLFDTQATNSNVILEPKPFPMEFRSRSKEKADIIMEQYAEVRAKLKV